MKVLKSLLVILFFLCISVAFSQNKPPFINWVTVFPNDYLEVSKTEVSNAEYAEFVEANNSWVVQEGDSILLLPDSARWILLDEKFQPMVEMYFRHPAYANYPVVNISKQQAQLFCEWKTKQVNEDLVKYKSKFDSVVVRLPTRDEWKYIATSGHPFYTYSWEGQNMRYTEGKNMGDFRCNFNSSKYSSNQFGDFAELTAPVFAYQPNELGVFNVCGNVAEFVEDQDLAYGGHYFSSYENVTVNSTMNAIAMPTNGFRYVIEVIRLKPSKATLPNQLTKKFFSDFFAEYQFGDTLLSKTEIPIWLYKMFAIETNRTYPSINSVDGFNYVEFIQENYFSHSNYYDQPVFGITPQDAEAFCSWFAKKYKEKTGESVQIQLPTLSNWYNAVKVNEKYKNELGLPSDFDEALQEVEGRSDCFANYYQRKQLFLNTNRKIDVPYLDLLGNVAELVQTKNGYAIVGHSVLDKIDEAEGFYAIRNLIEQSVLTGFRIVLIQ